MIFRRSNDSASKSMASSNGRPQNSVSTPQNRREPELSTRPYPTATTPTPSAQPMSPLAMAQARRTTGTPNTMSNFNRQEQLRKLTVGRDISLNGEITTCDHLIVEGTVRATIKGGQVLEISESGAFSGIVDIDQAEIAGVFEGDLIVRSKLVLRATARVNGTIRYGSLQVDTGASLTGEIAPLQAAMQTAPVAPTYAAQPSTMSETPVTTPSSSYDLSSVMQQSGFLKASA